MSIPVTWLWPLSAVKYLGLLAMSKILKTHPKSVQSHKDLILQCLDDKDESIRLRALDLLYGMVRALCPPARLSALGDVKCQVQSHVERMESPHIRPSASVVGQGRGAPASSMPVFQGLCGHGARAKPTSVFEGVCGGGGAKPIEQTMLGQLLLPGWGLGASNPAHVAGACCLPGVDL